MTLYNGIFWRSLQKKIILELWRLIFQEKIFRVSVTKVLKYGRKNIIVIN